jgi:hypothetical protein
MLVGIVTLLRILLCSVVAVLPVAPAWAHGFGERFVLPLPVWLWVSGVGLTLALTFAIMVLVVRDSAVEPRAPAAADPASIPAPRFARATRALVAAITVTAVMAGFVGNQDPFANILPTFVWVLGWVGVAFASALVRDVWAVANPLRTAYAWAEAVYAHLTNGSALSRNLPYPARWGQWPAVLVFLLFVWGELIWASNDVPRHLARAITAYAAVTWTGMWLFGREQWLRHGEAFAIAFGILGRFAPVYLDAAGGVRARLPGEGLLTQQPAPFSLLVFVLLMLSSVTFDGFLQTPAFQAIVDGIYGSPAIAGFLYQLSEIGITDLQIVMTVGLLLFLGAFVLAYWIAAAAMVRLAGSKSSIASTAGLFVLTLVPISVAYHVAHYFSLLATAGQMIIPLVSDPFGWGWDLFGTKGYEVNIAIVSPYVQWYGAVALIVLGHILAVYLAHRVALRVFGSLRAASISQVPMIALMVTYTMVSLWIMAQPIVG